jgi:hypothetical protein
VTIRMMKEDKNGHGDIGCLMVGCGCSMTFLTRQAFAKQFGQSPDDLDMHVIYDVSHNIAKVIPQ